MKKWKGWVYLKLSQMRKWNGKECSNEKMERLGVLEGKFNEVLERMDALEGMFN